MGFFSFIKRGAGKVFGGVKRAAKKVFKPVKRATQKVARAVSSVLDPINEAAKKIAQKLNVNLPIVGNPLERLQQLPVVGKGFKALANTSKGIDAIEDYGNGNTDAAKEKMKEVAKSLAPKNARRVMKLVERLT